MSQPTSIRIGTGAGFAGDRIEPAVVLAAEGALDYLVLECLAERTIALAQLNRLKDPSGGFDPRLEQRMQALLPICSARKVRIITNSGAANPGAGARAVVGVARRLGLFGLKVAAITGDDVMEQVLAASQMATEEDLSVGLLGSRMISANAYLGAESIVEALRQDADVIITGRVADPSLFLAPQMHAFGWAEDDWSLLGRGILVGHLLECGGQLTGGYYADPPYKHVPDLARLGFPIAEVAADGSAVFSKVAGTGGVLNVATCTEQLLYEVHDPSRYLTPDVVADFTQVRFTAVSENRVRAECANGTARPATLKVTVAYRDGYIGEGQISYAGSGALARARLALDVVAERLSRLGGGITDLRCEIIGVDSIIGSKFQDSRSLPLETRIRVVGRAGSAADAAEIGNEVEALYTNGPAGGGGAAKTVREVIGIASVMIPRNAVRATVHYEVT
jgi:hypothetical protein